VHPSQIKREVEAIIAKMSTQGANVLKYGAAMRADSPGWRHTAADAPGWRQVVSRGAWNELVLFGGGERIEANCVAAPATLRAIESVPDATALARCGCSRDDPDMFRSTAGQPPQTSFFSFMRRVSFTRHAGSEAARSSSASWSPARTCDLIVALATTA